MEIGLIGLGRMGANMSLRLMSAGHKCIVHDNNPKAVQELAKQGASGASGLEDLVERLSKPRRNMADAPSGGGRCRAFVADSFARGGRHRR